MISLEKEDKEAVKTLSWGVVFSTAIVAALLGGILFLSLGFYLYPKSLRDGDFDGRTLVRLVSGENNSRDYISLDELWELEGDYYQTIIGLLMFVNTLIAGFSIWTIKANSDDRTREVVKKEVESYMCTLAYDDYFDKKLSPYIESKEYIGEQVASIMDNNEISIVELRKRILHCENRVRELCKDNRQIEFDLAGDSIINLK